MRTITVKISLSGTYAEDCEGICDQLVIDDLFPELPDGVGMEIVNGDDPCSSGDRESWKIVTNIDRIAR